MQLNLEQPDYRYFLRGADGSSARVNEQRLLRSFIIAPNALVEDWPVTDARTLTASDLAPVFALQPEVILLGTGASQIFPSAAVLATCLQRSIGLEVMTNAAAARTYSVLAGEGRRVAAGLVLPG